MIYDKKSLRATALSVKAMHEASAKTGHARDVALHKKRLAEWEARGKTDALEALNDALRATRANKPVNTNRLYRLPTAPEAPGACDCCTPATQVIDSLVALLDTIKDDVVSSSALSQAGFKDLNRLLRRPC